MKKIWLDESTNEILLYLFISLSFLYGILSYQHYAPSFHDFYIQSIAFSLCGIGLFFFFIRKNIKIYLNSFFWIILFLIFLIQPIFYNIVYVDGLIFPLTITLLMFFLSVAISNFSNREKLIRNISFLVALTAILLWITQVVHIFKIENIISLMKLPLQNNRFSGNIFQPNQAAFVFVLGVISLMYTLRGKYILLNYFLIFILSLGVAFTVSRSGFLILILSVLIFEFLLNYFENIPLYKLKFFIICVLGLVLGVMVYPYFSPTINIVDRATTSLGDTRLAHIHQSWLIISEHPIMGIGWKNFTGTGLTFSDQISWFNTVDHSHFFLTQLWTEFGVLGLGLVTLFGYILIKNIKISTLNEAYVAVFLMVIMMYSCFEYPLWQFRYLIIFAVFLSLYDRSEKIYYTFQKGYIISTILVVFIIGSLYYSYQYMHVARAFEFVGNSKNSIEDKTSKVLGLDLTYGLGFFNDLMIYEVIAEGNYTLEDKISMGNKIVNYFPTYPYLVRHGTLLGLNGNQEQAIYYLSASCDFDYGQHCKYTKEHLKSLVEQEPSQFKEIYHIIENKYGE